MSLVELDARLKEMKIDADKETIISYNNYRIDYDVESGGFCILLMGLDEWGNNKIIEWVATVNHVIDVIKIVQ